MPITLDQIVPTKDTIWLAPFDEYPDFLIELVRVDARKLDVILQRSKIKVRRRNQKGRFVEEEDYSQTKTAAVYAKEIFINFKGLIDKDGKPVENTFEQRFKMLENNNSLLSFVIEFAHDEGQFMTEQKRKDEDDFLLDSKPSPKSSSTPSQSA